MHFSFKKNKSLKNIHNINNDTEVSSTDRAFARKLTERGAQRSAASAFTCDAAVRVQTLVELTLTLSGRRYAN